MDTINILMIGETPGLAQDLLLALRRRMGFRVLGPVPDDVAALGLFAEARPDIVVVELDRLDGRGVAIISAISTQTQVRVMAAARCPSTREVELALAAGACGVLTTEGGPSSLVSAFRRAAAGELVLPADDRLPFHRATLAGELQEARSRHPRRDLFTMLTEREREVIEAIARGATTSGIALEFGISPATVQTHVKNILRKLEVHSKVEAVSVAWRWGVALDARSA